MTCTLLLWLRKLKKKKKKKKKKNDHIFLYLFVILYFFFFFFFALVHLSLKTDDIGQVSLGQIVNKMNFVWFFMFLRPLYPMLCECNTANTF